jgi:histidinol-phosphate aminotransferase
MQKYFRSEVLESPLYKVDHVRDAIKLNQNESPWDIPVALKAKITERLIKTDWNRYPVTDLQDLQTKLAKLLEVDPDQVVISNGSNTIIQALINVINPHYKVLILDPCFVIYEMQAKLHGNKVIKVPLSEDFELPTEKMLATIDKEKPGLIFIANPNAPTGTLFDKKSLYRILEAANCPVVIDEAYYPFTKETAIDWLDDFDNLIIMRTFSKAMALAGVRVGFTVSHPEIAAQIEKFLMTFRLPTVTSVIIDEVLENHDYMEGYVADIVKERGRLFSRLQQFKELRVFPSEANFLLVRTANSTEVCKRMMNHGILIRNIDNGTSLKDCFRVNVGLPEENDAFIATLKIILDEMSDE